MLYKLFALLYIQGTQASMTKATPNSHGTAADNLSTRKFLKHFKFNDHGEQVIDKIEFRKNS